MQYLLVVERDYNDADLGKLKNLVAALFLFLTYAHIAHICVQFLLLQYRSTA